MSGLVSGLQNRVRRFESARNLKESSEIGYYDRFRRILVLGGMEIGVAKTDFINADCHHSASTSDVFLDSFDKLVK